MKRIITWKLLLIFTATILLQDVAARSEATAQPERPKYSLAVLELEGAGRVSSADAGDLTERLREELQRAGIFQVQDKAALKTALASRNLSLVGCTTKECAVQIGRAAGTKLVVTGSVSKVGPLYFIQAQLVHVKSGEIVESVSEDFDGEFAALKDHMAVIARKLSGQALSANTRPGAMTESETRQETAKENAALENAEDEFSATDAFDYRGKKELSPPSKKGGNKALVIGLIVAGAAGGGFLISQALKDDGGDGVKPPPAGGNLPNPPTFP
jgi:TolB-like protein